MEAHTFLLVEDDENQVEMAMRVFRKHQLGVQVVVVNHGKEALDWLLGRCRLTGHRAKRQPSLIILDLDMPVLDGRETLSRIRQTDELKNIPVVIFTSSDEPENIHYCYERGANGFVKKPFVFSEFENALLCIASFWGGINVPPSCKL